LLGTSVLFGWLTKITLLETVLPHRITMKSNTAIGFLLAGAALLLLNNRATTPKKKWASVFLSIGVIAIGLSTLVEYALHVNFGLDQWLFADHFQLTYPGRMAHITALSFCLTGTSLLFMALWERKGYQYQLLSCTTFLGALLAMVGYLYGVPLLYGSLSYTSMAIHTGGGF